jgi:uncharacterized protein YoxC
MSSTIEKAEKLNADIYKSDFALIAEVQRTCNLLSRKEAIHRLCDAYRGIKSDASGNTPACPEDCKNCELFSGVDKDKVICVLKLENKLPNIKHISLIDAEACSRIPTLITLERKTELQIEMTRLRGQIKKDWEAYQATIQSLQKQYDGISRPHKELLSKYERLKSRASVLKNGLVRKIEEIERLSLAIQGLNGQIGELSANKVVEKNAFLLTEIGRKDENIEDLKRELEGQEALVEHKNRVINDIVTEFSKALRDFKQYRPTTTDPYQLHDYIEKVGQKIQNLEGFIATVTT